MEERGDSVSRRRLVQGLIAAGAAGVLGLELPRFRGHISSKEEVGVHDAQDTSTISS
jgi:hypothetical protein